MQTLEARDMLRDLMGRVTDMRRVDAQEPVSDVATELRCLAHDALDATLTPAHTGAFTHFLTVRVLGCGSLTYAVRLV